ncbi:hypothetical protein [Sphingosinicella xenopeptidilytica]|uniref:Glycosyl transferase n=1 Tax=Sphingosinicella xenopeptidilytica TaxID=364098 RepID=A0ABW3C028_SPHXN
MSQRRVAFLFVGGAHQVLHSASVAAELGRDPRFDVTCFVAQEEERGMLEQIARAWPDSRLSITDLPAPLWSSLIGRLWPKLRAMKLPRLLANRKRLFAFDAIVLTERTSTILKKLPGCPPLIHIPHGAGDRARGFEPRLRLFDLVIVSGDKDAHRMTGEGLVAESRIAVSGSTKLDALDRLGVNRPKLFDNDKPVVLYNPHFEIALSSWPRWGQQIIDAFAAQSDFNLIVAPHIRLFEGASAADRAALEARAIPGRIIVDAGSARSCDMTYTNAADIYVGDVSSQVYEFLARPRPCVFLDSTGADWKDDPNYAFWHLGDVVTDLSDVLSATARAAATHTAYSARQNAAVSAAVGGNWHGASARAAAAIAGFVTGAPASGALASTTVRS